jgi:hypothetical protein
MVPFQGTYQDRGMLKKWHVGKGAAGVGGGKGERKGAAERGRDMRRKRSRGGTDRACPVEFRGVVAPSYGPPGPYSKTS